MRMQREGRALGDFLDQQIKKLAISHEAAVKSGLALDFLAYHTSDLGTAAERSAAELGIQYRHQARALPGLLQQTRELHLLVDPRLNQQDRPPASRLAHDTLAPLVRQRFSSSEAPGQRARRVLENRAVDWEAGKEGPPLDEADLLLVEAGQRGMRFRKPDEDRLMQASAAAQVLRLEEQRQQAQALAKQESKSATRLRLLVAILTVLALIAPGWWVRQQILKRQAESPLVEVPATQLTVESSASPIEVPAFSMEQYEVSNWRYNLCVQANACEVPVDPKTYKDASFASHPVVYVTAYQADNYCRWLGRRLPTSLEWLRVARGPDGNSWPWGEEPIDPSRVNMSFINSQSSATSPVNSHPEGRSKNPEGIYHLIGNVWEWTATPLKQDPYSTYPEWKRAIIDRSDVGLIVLGGAYRGDATRGELDDDGKPIAREPG